MNTLNLTDFPPASQQSVNSVFEYSLSVIDRDGNIQKLTAAFSFVPSDSDWSEWLSGWIECGYARMSQPLLIRVI